MRGTYMQQRLHAIEEVNGAGALEPPVFLEDEYITHMFQSSDKEEEWFEEVTVHGEEISLKLDSGATCNVMPLEMYQRVTALDRLNPGPRVRNYGASGGYLKVWVHSQDLWFVVVNSLKLNLLWLTSLGNLPSWASQLVKEWS